MFSWTIKAVETLRDLWPHHSATQIAMELGTTRGSVMGKVHRLGFEPKKIVHRLSNTRSRKHRATGNPVIKLRRYSEKQLPEREMPMLIAPLNIPFMDLQDHQCREVLSTGEDGLAIYCGHKQREGSSYCPHHSAVNEHLAPPRARRAA